MNDDRRPMSAAQAAAGMAWAWSALLLFFPAWWLGHAERALRLRSLGLALAWIAVSAGGLYLWLRRDRDPETGFRAPPPEPRQTRALGALAALAGLLSLWPAAYPLSISGDEESHAGVFRNLGRVPALLLERALPHPAAPWLAAGALLATAWLLWRKRRAALALAATPAGWALLAAAAAGSVAAAELVVEPLLRGALPGASTDYLKDFVRFQPLSKFLWLPVSLIGWESLFVLRLPSIGCFLAAAFLLHRTVALRERGWPALLPPALLLFLPGMFYAGHLLYLTPPMLVAWCAALYFYERHQLSGRRRDLVAAALALNLGAFVRLETGYLALALLVHRAWSLRRGPRRPLREEAADLAGLAWLGVSLIPLWATFSHTAASQLGLHETGRLLEPAKLVAILNDLPYHLGPVGTPVLAWCALSSLWRRPGRFSPALVGASWTAIAVLYALCTMFYIIPDERGIGLFPLGREWQTGQRYPISWSPFFAVLLAEGVARLGRFRVWGGALLACALFAQATFWAAPLSLPEFTSLRLRPDAEYPHLPTAEAMRLVSERLAGEGTRVLSPGLPVSFYSKPLPPRGRWSSEGLPESDETPDDLHRFCARRSCDLLVLPLLWPHKRHERMYREALRDPRFRVEAVLPYAGEPGIAVLSVVPRGKAAPPRRAR